MSVEWLYNMCQVNIFLITKNRDVVIPALISNNISKWNKMSEFVCELINSDNSLQLLVKTELLKIMHNVKNNQINCNINFL